MNERAEGKKGAKRRKKRKDVDVGSWGRGG